MSRVSPTLEGFRAAFRRPSLTFAEISWRWTAGAIAWALLLFGFVEFLDTLRVSKGDAALLATRQPLLVGRAIQHILHGSLSRASMAALFAALALSILWISLASIGRAATVRALLEYFRDKFAEERSPSSDEIFAAKDAARNPPTRSRPLPSLIGLNFLRIAVALAALLALVGAAVLVSFASTEKNPHPGLVFVLYLPLAGMVCLVWSALNWLLSLAGLFAVRDGAAENRKDTLGAISEAVIFFRANPGAVFAVSTLTGLAHLTAFSVATTAVSMPLAFLQFVPGRLVLAAVILITLVYFAVVDWLYIARLAGYACIAELPETFAASAPSPTPPPAPVQTTIDRNELILSDIPGLA
ncbi:MAG: hypothetical protein ACLQLC_17480 [Candidatus Sulfotelmatobacter sp.]